ncbi:MAG: alanine racemase [Nocardioidaceae bacterium]
MPLSLYVDGPRWREHLTTTAAAYRGIVPVAKGNGYGFGVPRLARRAEWLGAGTLAIGTYAEVDAVRQRFSGDILVMEPWRPFHRHIAYDKRIIHTVGRPDDLVLLAERDDHPRVLLEALTSMHRHGFPEQSMRDLPAAPKGVRVEGHALHLPLGTGHIDEVEHWLALMPSSRRWFVSHLNDAELLTLQQRHRDLQFRPRIGTALWLGDRGVPRCPRHCARDTRRQSW